MQRRNRMYRMQCKSQLKHQSTMGNLQLFISWLCGPFLCDFPSWLWNDQVRIEIIEGNRSPLWPKFKRELLLLLFANQIPFAAERSRSDCILIALWSAVKPTTREECYRMVRHEGRAIGEIVTRSISGRSTKIEWFLACRLTSCKMRRARPEGNKSI